MIALAANSRADVYPYYYDSSLPDTRPGPTTVIPTLSMSLTIIMILGFDIILNHTRIGDFFGMATLYGVARTDSGE